MGASIESVRAALSAANEVSQIERQKQTRGYVDAAALANAYDAFRCGTPPAFVSTVCEELLTHRQANQPTSAPPAATDEAPLWHRLVHHALLAGLFGLLCFALAVVGVGSALLAAEAFSRGAWTNDGRNVASVVLAVAGVAGFIIGAATYCAKRDG